MQSSRIESGRGAYDFDQNLERRREALSRGLGFDLEANGDKGHRCG